MGVGPSILTFTGASAFTSGTLTINNYTGNFNTGNGSDQIIFSGSGFTANTLENSVSFNIRGTSYGGLFINHAGGTIELIPVIPEASTWFGGALILFFVCLSGRSKLCRGS